MAKNLESETYVNDSDHSIAGPGPYVFYCCAAAIANLVGDRGDEPSFRATLKCSALEAWSRVAHLPKANRVDALRERTDIVRSYNVFFDDSNEGRETFGARCFRADWHLLKDIEYQLRKLRKKNVLKEERERWYEMTVQREKPEDGTPGLEVELEDQGTWWVIAIRATDKASRIAMYDVGQILCNRVDW